MKWRKLLAGMLAVCLAASMMLGCSSSSESEEETEAEEEAEAEDEEEEEDDSSADIDYPNGNINGIVMWAEGGTADTVLRPLATLASDVLGSSIVVQNKTGGAGSIATQYVYDEEADGYNLLLGAENPCLYDVLGVLDLTYENYECAFLVGDVTTGVVVAADSEYTSLTEIVDAALAGETVTLASTGTAGLPWEVIALITSVTGAEFTQVQYDSDSAAKTAVLSGECDFTICTILNGIEEYQSGDLIWLSMLSTEVVEGMEDVPLITEEYPDFEEYLPWGPFYGVFVKEGTDQAIIDILADAFTEAYEDESYQEVLESLYVNPLGYTGDEAEEYISTWTENTVNALTTAGMIE